MPIIIAAAAAMQYYYKNNEHIQKTIRQIDPSINLKQKSTIRLHAIEQTMTLYEPPITTITYCSVKHEMDTDGDIKSVPTFVSSFQQRLEEIIQVNPWLCGWLLPMPDLHIVYDPTGRDRTPSYMTIHTTARSRHATQTNEETKEVGIHHTQHEDHHYEMYQDTIVSSNHELIGRNQPIFKVSIVPIVDVDVVRDDHHASADVSSPSTTSTNEYAVIMSMSHLVGDAHTYYQIYNMLFYAQHDSSQMNTDATSIPCHIQPLNPIRVSNYVSSVQNIFGNDHNTSVMYHHPFQHHQQQQLYEKKIGSTNQEVVTNKMKAKLITFMKNVKAKRNAAAVNAMETKRDVASKTDDVSAVSDDTISDLDISYDSHHSSTTTSSNSISNEDNTSNNTDDSISMPTVTADVATVIPELPIQQLPKKRVMKVFRINYEWLMTQRNVSLAESNDADIATTSTGCNHIISVNSVLSSWFYRITESSTCILMMNLRNKIDTHCTITNTDVGNYAHTMIGNDTEFYHPRNIQNAVRNITPTTTNKASNASTEEQFEMLNVNDIDKESSTKKKKVSICTNWINFPLTSTELSNASSSHCQVKLHLPIYKNNVTENIPAPQEPELPDVSVMTLFHLQQPTPCLSPDINTSTIISMNDSDDSNNLQYHIDESAVSATQCTNNIGAIIICSEDVWMNQIVPSGVVVSIASS